MDTAFQLSGDGRANFLQILAQSTGCSYVCLWSCLPDLSSCLCSLDGFYQESGSSMQPSSSAGSLAWRLFDEYRTSLIIIDNKTSPPFLKESSGFNSNSHSSLPGFAFKTNRPYVELKEEDLPRLATNHTQRKFYREAKIKKAVFMGCRSGEIELGFSNMSPDNPETLMKALFPEDFSRQVGVQELPRAIEQQLNPPSSSSSSWRSLSLDSPEYSSLLFNFPGSPFIPDSLKEVVATVDPQAVVPPPQTLAAATPTVTIPQQLQALQALARIPNLQFAVPGREHEAMTKAFLAVMSSPSSSTSSSQQQQQNLPGASHQANPRDSAFARYSSALLPTRPQLKPTAPRRDSMIKRSLAYLRNLNLLRARERVQAAPGTGSRPTSTQLHHMMSERKRREKLNESLQALKSLLPPGTKRDKASVLASTRDYLTSLKAQIEDLRQRNAALEAQLPPKKEETEEPGNNPINSANPIDVRVRQTSESTSHDRTVDLQVTVRRECNSMQLVIRILEFLRQLNNVHLISVEANTRATGAEVVTRGNLRLRIEGNEWDESAFEEAVRRVVSDVAQR